MSSHPPTPPPPSSRDGGLVLWAVAGVLVFVVIAALTVTVLLQGKPPERVTVPATDPMATIEPTRPASPPSTAAPRQPARLEDNILTSVALAETTCPELRLQRTDLHGPELQAYLDSVAACLVSAYAAPLHAAGITLGQPVIAPESEIGDSVCTTSPDEPDDWAGLYCGANQTIYIRTAWTPDSPLQYVEVVAHEFAHHLQHQTGILASVAREQQATHSEPNGAARAMELSRRLELQAECLTGMAVGPEGPLAVRETEFADFVASRVAVAPEWAATHGTGRAQTRWFKSGAKATGPDRLASCNTFAAPAETVD